MIDLADLESIFFIFIMANNPMPFTSGEQTMLESSPSRFMYKNSPKGDETRRTYTKIAGDLFGTYSSGYGHTKSCGINLAILTITLAALAAMAYVLYTKITMAGRRRRRRELSLENWDDLISIDLSEIVLDGIYLNFFAYNKSTD